MSLACGTRNIWNVRFVGGGIYNKFSYNDISRTSEISRQKWFKTVRFLSNSVDVNHAAASRLRTNWGHYKDEFKAPTTTTFGCWERDSISPLSDCHGKETMDEVPPLLMPSLLKLRAESNPNDVALSVFRDGEWQKTTYSEYHENTRIVAKAFIELGLEPFCSVNPIGFNSPEHYMAFQAAPMAGGFMAGIYPTNR